MDEAAADLLSALVQRGDAARLRSCSGPGSDWLYAALSTGDAWPDDPPAAQRTLSGPWLARRSDSDSLHVHDRDAALLMRLRLGLPVGRLGVCGRSTSDKLAKKASCAEQCTPRHLLVCPCGGWVRARHDRVARQLQLLALEIAGASVDWEPAAPDWPQEGGEPGQPDLVIRVPGWRVIHVDVAIAVPSESGPPGAAALDKEGRKRAKYPSWIDRVKRRPLDFAPCVLESYGWLGGDTEV